MTKTEKLVDEINLVHQKFSEDYFETDKVEKINLSHTLQKLFPNGDIKHIYNYRLNLHESINDYLMESDLEEIKFYYRVKTRESIDDKISRYSERSDQYPVNSWLNDIFGARIVLNDDEISEVIAHLDEWQEKYGLKNWYVRNKDGYNGIHVYFKNKNNFYFPWELQIWNEKDKQLNIENHRKFKRNFV
ncbi:GTP pyrophosphokinase [Lactococcus insecticola]|uniref:GTP pyrophosphokinase n=1 Tax=Pseudolactococcus insecticola TaxID=2709158 RepID=A0A6A0B7B4_9LACT|nr:GTP pyrophosphokinase [Lactococcus insecticola]